jgi:hypothetical protein
LALPVFAVSFTLTPYINDSYHERENYFAAHGYVFAIGIIAKETVKDAHTANIKIYNDSKHASVFIVPVVNN